MKCPRMIKMASIGKSISNIFTTPNPIYKKLTNEENIEFKELRKKIMLGGRKSVDKSDYAKYIDYDRRGVSRLPRPLVVFPTLLGLSGSLTGSQFKKTIPGAVIGAAAGVALGLRQKKQNDKRYRGR